MWSRSPRDSWERWGNRQALGQKMGSGANSPDKAPTPQASPSRSWGLCDWGDTSTCSEGQTERAEHCINALLSVSLLFRRNEETVPAPGGTLLAMPCPLQASILPVGLGQSAGLSASLTQNNKLLDTAHLPGTWKESWLHGWTLGRDAGN